jgi:hypothetical protein
VRPDDCDLPHIAVERQQAAVVLQQRHRPVRESPRELVALAGDAPDLDRVFLDVRVLEEPERELVPQDAPHRLVELLLREQAALDGPDERRPVAVGRRRLDVHSCSDAECPDLLGARGHELAGLRPADAVVVRDDRSREPHAAAEEVREDGAARVHRHALELRVGRHHAREPREPDRGLERTAVHVVELPRAHRDRGHVLARLGLRVADEVLRTGDHAFAQVVALHPVREGDAHRADEIRVLAVRLGHTSPARVARDVHDRRERMEHADCAHLATHHVCHLLDPVRVPGRGERDRGREGGEPGSDDPVQRFVVEDRRDLQACLRDEVVLDRVDARRDLVRQLVPEEADPGNVPDAVRQEALELVADRAVRAEQRERNDRGELHRLLLECHLAQKLVRALHWRRCRRGHGASSRFGRAFVSRPRATLGACGVRMGQSEDFTLVNRGSRVRAAATASAREETPSLR